MSEELNRLMILLETTYQQIAMVKYDLSKEEKRSIQTLDVQIERKVKATRAMMDQGANDYFDTMSILFLETIREVQRCTNPKVAVSILQALNEGCEILVDGVSIKDYNPPGKYQNEKVA
jgi:hypothetical protein